MVFSNKTKIIATIGPASMNKAELRAMITAGVDVMRINGAHGSEAEHARAVELVRSVAKSMGQHTAVLFDLPGPKIRLGELKSEPVMLKKGSIVTIACGSNVQSGDKIPVPEKFIAKAATAGTRIFINDGLVEVKVVSIDGLNLTCRVVAGGEIRSRKGLNLPNVDLPVSSLNRNDLRLLKLAIALGVDYVGLSFVRTAKDVKDLKKILSKKSPQIGVIAKIEKPEALGAIDEIIKAADAVMIARGDLGIEMPFYELPAIQNDIILRCRYAGKPVITATQMMESMVLSAMPTRAEATDVAMAVWEGTDAVMLSEETSIGKNPAKAVSAMARIAQRAERDIHETNAPCEKSDKKEFQAQTICFAAATIADKIDARAIVTPTRTGRTPLFVSGLRPYTLIIAPTEDEHVARIMQLFWGVFPIVTPTFSSVDETLRCAAESALNSSLIKKGDTIVITSGAHGKKDDITRLLEVRTV
jgi:pyruvate kinase